MEKVFIASACRTPIGKMGGTLSSVSAVDLGSIVIHEAVKRAHVEQVDHAYMGCVIQAGLGQNVARQSAVKAGLGYETTAETLNAVCGSGLDAVNSAARLIRTGEAEAVVAGGMESMSQAPFALMKGRFGYRMGSPMVDTPLIDTMVNDALWDAINNYHMGVTAENVAKRWNISRTELDEFAIFSQKKASRAISEGAFNNEIIPVVVRDKKGDKVISRDEGPRKDLTFEDLKKLKPAFQKDGIITAGNSSGINDGAAAVVLVSEKKVKELNITPLAEWIGGAIAGVDPSIMGIGPVASTQKLLNHTGYSICDIDLFEANEAFASQSIAVKRELDIPDEKLNVNGGAIALGHPVGASGCRILVTLLYAMLARQSNLGLATLCIGGGMGCSALIRRYTG